jgi:hypothetical protein
VLRAPRPCGGLGRGWRVGWRRRLRLSMTEALATAAWEEVWAAQEALRALPLPQRWRSCLEAWRALPGGSWAAQMVEHGVSWDWLQPVPLATCFPLPQPQALPEERAALETLVDQLVQQGALVPIEARVEGRHVHVSAPMWLSPAFVVEKARVPGEPRRWRLVISLKRLNRFTQSVPFRLPTVTDAVLSSVQGTTRYGKIDLVDAFHQARVAPCMWPYLGVVVPSGQVYSMRVLPMGSCHSPRLFQKLLAPVIAQLRASVADEVLGYLDDILCLRARMSSGADDTMLQAARLLTRLGITISREKSSTQLASKVLFLGLELDADAACVRVPAPKWTAFRRAARQMERRVLAGSSVTARSVAQLVGRLRSLRPAVESAHYLSTSLVQWLRVLAQSLPRWDASRPMAWSTLPLDATMPAPDATLRAALLSDLRRWATLPAALRECPMARWWQSPTLLTLASDASSTTGFGATLAVHWPAVSRLPPPHEVEASGHATLRGRWTAHELRVHVNALETLAVARAITWATAWWRRWCRSPPLIEWLGAARAAELAGLLSRSSMRVLTDSTTAVATINTLRPRSLDLARATAAVHAAMTEAGAPARVRAAHVPGVANVEPDRLSRARVARATDWAVPSDVFELVCRRARVRPQTDLCATAMTSKCRWFVGLRASRHPAQIATDALTTNWDELPGPLYLAPGAAARFLMPVLLRLELFLPRLRQPVLLILPGWETAWRRRLRAIATRAARAMWIDGLEGPLPNATRATPMPWVALALWPPTCAYAPAGQRPTSRRRVRLLL